MSERTNAMTNAIINHAGISHFRLPIYTKSPLFEARGCGKSKEKGGDRMALMPTVTTTDPDGGEKTAEEAAIEAKKSDGGHVDPGDPRMTTFGYEANAETLTAVVAHQSQKLEKKKNRAEKSNKTSGSESSSGSMSSSSGSGSADVPGKVKG